MDRPTKMKLSVELDMRTALRLARFEVETGVGLDQLLVRAVEEWEAEHQLEPPLPREERVPIRWDYSPRGWPSKYRVDGLYDLDTNQVQITHAPVEIGHLIGERGAPSRIAMDVVKAVKPGITPNRNGMHDWRVVGTGQTIGDLRGKR